MNDFFRKTLSYLLQHEVYPLGFMLRQVQQKVLNKLTKVIISPPVSQGKNEEMVLNEHFKSITHGKKGLKSTKILFVNVTRV